MLKHRFFLKNENGSDMYFHYYAPSKVEDNHKIQYGYALELTTRSAFHRANYAALNLDADTQQFTFKAVPQILVNMQASILENVKRVSLLT